MTANSDRKQIEEQAADWLQVLHEGMPSDSVMADFDRWMNLSARHSEVYAEMSESYYALDFGDGFGGSLDESKGGEQESEIALACSQVVPIASAPKKTAASSRSTRRPLAYVSALVGSLAVAASFFAVFILGQFSLPHTAAELVSPIGEVKLHELADASTVHLNTNTSLNIDYDVDDRSLSLISGEAYFSVAKDPSRPFVVHTDGATVKALGTEFMVHNRGAGKIRVSVYESSVEVFHPQYLSDAVVLEEGDLLEFGPDILNPTVTSLAEDTQPSWRENRLIFNNATLSEVAEILGEYHRGKILIGDEVQNVRISGVFHDIDAARILADIADAQNLSSLKLANHVIYIY